MRPAILFNEKTVDLTRSGGMRKSCLYQNAFPKGCVLRVKIPFSLFIYLVERQIILMAQN